MTQTLAYLNACSHGPPSAATLQAMIDHLTLEAAVGETRARDRRADALTAVRARAAAVLGARTEDTGFCAATTPIWTRVLDRVARPGARVVLSALEWGDHLRHARSMTNRVGMRLDVIPAAKSLDVSAWAARLDDDVAVIAVPLVTSIAGRMPPLASIAALPRPESTLLLVDAAQGVGRVAAHEILRGVDVVAATTRKWLRAPRQTAVFSLSPRAQALLGLTVQEVEGSIPNAALRLALGQALAEAAGPDGAPLDPAIPARIAALDAMARDGLRDRRPDLALAQADAPGTVTALVPLAQQPATDAALTRAGVAAKWCAPAAEEPAAGFDSSVAPLRVSPHAATTDDEIARFLDAMAAAQG